jgi:hypothetical protein
LLFFYSPAPKQSLAKQARRIVPGEASSFVLPMFIWGREGRMEAAFVCWETAKGGRFRFRLLGAAKGERFRFSSRCAFLAQRDALGVPASLGAEPSALRLSLESFEVWDVGMFGFAVFWNLGWRSLFAGEDGGLSLGIYPCIMMTYPFCGEYGYNGEYFSIK